MKYDLDEVVPHRNSNSYKWDAATEESVLPMWTADMDFRTAPAVVEVLYERTDHGIFNYTKVPSVYYDATINWLTRRRGWQIDRGQIIYASGAVPALSVIIKALTVPGDRMLVQASVYNCFFSSIHNNGCEIVANPLVCTNGTHRIDFNDLVRKATDPKVRLLLLCNPRNPVGRVWTRAELMRIGGICLRNDALVVADEIHCGLVYSGHTYIPFASISSNFRNRSVTCASPGKTFNLAGLQIANIFATDKSVCMEIDKATNLNKVCDVNPFDAKALAAAYNDGEERLKELKCYPSGNYLYMRIFFNRYFPQSLAMKLEGTYLVWVDYSALNRSSREIAGLLLKAEKLQTSGEGMYGEAGEGFIRIDTACPRQTLINGLDRLKRGPKKISLCYCRDRQILLHDIIE